MASPAKPQVPAKSKASPALDFLREIIDEPTRHYRAFDDSVELFAGLYSDGRIRLADDRGTRLAGALQGSHANVIDLTTRIWSEVELQTTPTGKLQLKFYGEPYGDRLLTCESLRS